jgi:hypothetical protein
MLNILGHHLPQGKHISAVMKFLVVTSQEEEEEDEDE